MAAELKPGTRLRSSSCDAEVIVVKAPDGPVDLRCGGHPMAPMDAESTDRLAAEAGFTDGCLIGKRYTDESGALEVLCTKAGTSSLSVGATALALKDAKPLPSSD